MAPEASGGGMIRKGWTSDGATISECGSYRYWLGRSRNGGDGRVTFIMLNSSDADAERDDPTIRRCLGFAEAWVSVNLSRSIYSVGGIATRWRCLDALIR